MVKSTKQEKASSTTKKCSAPAPKKKYFDVFFYLDWCKACGLCIAFCPQKIISADKNGRPVMDDADRCVGCRFCEIHCPDFAITISERKPKRRRNDVS